jgi:hypothetical protein
MVMIMQLWPGQDACHDVMSPEPAARASLLRRSFPVPRLFLPFLCALRALAVTPRRSRVPVAVGPLSDESDPQPWIPETITIDDSEAYKAAIKRSNEEHSTAIIICQMQYFE